VFVTVVAAPAVSAKHNANNGKAAACSRWMNVRMSFSLASVQAKLTGGLAPGGSRARSTVATMV
jgi:hypothetical protein